ncbi:uncharacterized protein B0I36DRAFT_316045 [Microdochium trichocladiopsis]|uniref:Uncharacterized protein n=1 Tax=Microdochium trichocladiopsis TaxID=1682393 RepID=A0A9P8YF88_9PEZI|nr:uncharacterized protein B0I36DRAFT_316045 [Microdochium trichocladiopsis]KAH7038360.1 hypothetical protein B0I36DRAFT_316045 [Microdochium trichocladiopsis]
MASGLETRYPGTFTGQLTSSTTNMTCDTGPTTGQWSPDFVQLNIPPHLHAFTITAANETAVQAMLECCSPNLPNLAQLCYLWCEVPKEYYNGTITKDTSPGGVMDAFHRCLTDKGAKLGISGYQNAGVARSGPTIMAVGLWGLMVSGLTLVV